MPKNKDLKPGSLRVEDGKISMCLDPEWNCGGWGAYELWACVGKDYQMFSTYGRGIWRCVDIDPVRVTATFTKRVQIDGVRKRMTVPMTARNIKRYDEEKDPTYWESEETREQEKDEEVWSRAGYDIRPVDQPHLQAWLQLLGHSSFEKLDEILNTAQAITDVIVQSKGACSSKPTPDLLRNTAKLKTLLGNPLEKMPKLDELTSAEQALYGCVLGALLGDAAGGVLEFMSRKPTPEEVQNALTLPGGGALDLAPGQFTDDGEMAVCLLAALTKAEGTYRPKLVAQQYCDWVKSKPFDIGNATSNALMIEDESDLPMPIDKLVLQQAEAYNSASKANGSLMRAAPLGIAAARLNTEDAAKMARLDACMTHPNETCQHATAAYVLAIRHLIRMPGDKAGAWAAAATYAEEHSEEIREWLEYAATRKPGPATPLIGFVRHGFTAAFHHLRQGTGYREALAATLAQGGDTDTNACIVGGLMGALHGVGRIPQDMIDGLLNCDTSKGQQRPDQYTITPVLGYLQRLNAVVMQSAPSTN